MNFNDIKSLSIPEGEVAKIESNGQILWEAIKDLKLNLTDEITIPDMFMHITQDDIELKNGDIIKSGSVINYSSNDDYQWTVRINGFSVKNYSSTIIPINGYVTISNEATNLNISKTVQSNQSGHLDIDLGGHAIEIDSVLDNGRIDSIQMSLADTSPELVNEYVTNTTCKILPYTPLILRFTKASYTKDIVILENGIEIARGRLPNKPYQVSPEFMLSGAPKNLESKYMLQIREEKERIVVNITY